MDDVIHIIGAETSTDMLCELNALADPQETIVSIGPVRENRGLDRKTTQVRTILGSGAAAAWGIRRLEAKADLIHAWSPQAASAAQWSANGRPIVLSLPHLRRLHQADIAISGCFDGLWTLTAPTAPQRRVLITLGLDPKRVFVLPPAFKAPGDALGSRNRIRSELNLDDDCFLLAAGGEMTPANGHKQVCWAHAMSRIVNERTRLVFPSSGPARRAVETFVQSIGYPHEVFFTAGRMTPSDVLTAADAAIFLQRNDCGVGAVANAMACGLPILASDRPEIADCAPHGKSALLSPPGDVRQAADNLLSLINDEELRQKLANRAAEQAAEKFDPATNRNRLKEIYSTVLSACS
ncbi:MAG: glycosyltransferase family 4 protein [Phycisphaerae bacterium]|nr:glycosyltransferase family 4 protein [Phycisphaerae bacterium]